MSKVLKRVLATTVITNMIFSLTACGIKNEKQVSIGRTDIKGEVLLEDEFDEYNYNLFSKASGWSNGGMFNCVWEGENIEFNNGEMIFKLDENLYSQFNDYTGSEYRTNEKYHYGMYEVRMKPAKNKGVVSSFFTYTGPSDGTQWDEIDIEFLGKDTTKVQFNYWTNGKGENEFLYDLGFDASEKYHTYGFEWLEDSITWYIDGQAVYKAVENIPKTPGKIMMNLWPGIGVDEWLEPFDGNVPLTASYDWMRYTKYDLVN